MRAGALDRRVELQHRSLAAQNSTGEKVETWATYATVWAERIDIRGREFFAAGGVQADVATRFRIRWRSDVLITDRLILGASSFDLIQISEIGRRHGLELFGTAVVS